MKLIRQIKLLNVSIGYMICISINGWCVDGKGEDPNRRYLANIAVIIKSFEFQISYFLGVRASKSYFLTIGFMPWLGALTSRMELKLICHRRNAPIAGRPWKLLFGPFQNEFPFHREKDCIVPDIEPRECGA
jgi:hypothetical protein